MHAGQDDAIIIALGSNLNGAYPSSTALLRAALNRFPSLGLRVLAHSSWWRSAAWPDRTKPDYLNGVALVEATLCPARLLAALLELEETFGRVRGEANAPRTLDLDLIAYGRLILSGPELVAPHPRAAERRFVMGPLAEIAPSWIHPINGRTARVLAASAQVGADARPGLQSAS